MTRSLALVLACLSAAPILGVRADSSAIQCEETPVSLLQTGAEVHHRKSDVSDLGRDAPSEVKKAHKVYQEDTTVTTTTDKPTLVHRVVPKLAMALAIVTGLFIALMVYGWYFFSNLPREKQPLYMRVKLIKSLVPLLIFFVAGSIVLAYLEDWRFTTSFYVSTQILTTVGYGDLTAQSDAGKIFVTFYVLVIICFVASSVSDVVDEVVASANKGAIDHFMDLFASEVDADVSLGRRGSTSELLTKLEPGPGEIKKKKRSWVEKYSIKPLIWSVALFAVFVAFGTIFFAWYEDCSCSFGMTKLTNYADCKDDTYEHCMASNGGTKTVLEAFYMSVITLTTVGFGDFTPLTRIGRWVSIFWMIFGIVALGNMITAIAVSYRLFCKDTKSSQDEMRQLIRSVDLDNNQKLSRAEFLQLMLLKEGLITQSDVDHFDEIFSAMDQPKQGEVPVEKVFHKLMEMDGEDTESDMTPRK